MIISKLQERIHGYALTLKETHHKEAHTTPTIKPSAANDGTTIVCKNLFSNIPARQKFLKSDAVEFSHILDTFIPLAMIHPETEFTLTHNHKIINRLERGGSFRARIAELLGKHFFSTLIPLRFETDDYKINGYISAPEHAQEKSKHQHIFINKRPVKDFLILKACKTAFSNLIAELLNGQSKACSRHSLLLRSPIPIQYLRMNRKANSSTANQPPTELLHLFL
ncbi:MAG: mismatch repair protein MutL protein [Parcubacteria group bacterium GW2011_GWA2_44_12]|nr:MAG: mismatch repair protein MutL protein [Parcubacteria group bacterium GW2011_GWA2_44_12]